MDTKNISIQSEEFYKEAEKLATSDEVKKLSIFAPIIEIENIIAKEKGYWIRPEFRGPCLVAEGDVIIPRVPKEIEDVVQMWIARIIAPDILEEYLEIKRQTERNIAYEEMLKLSKAGDMNFWTKFFEFHYMSPQSLGVYRRSLTDKIFKMLGTDEQVIIDASFAREAFLDYIPKGIFDTSRVSSFVCKISKDPTGKFHNTVFDGNSVLEGSKQRNK